MHITQIELIYNPQAKQHEMRFTILNGLRTCWSNWQRAEMQDVFDLVRVAEAIGDTVKITTLG